ncbi:MAG: hypothetical protein ABJA78_09810 [Ferruginibacter sp.]
MEEEQDIETADTESRSSRFTEVIALLFVTIVMVFLYIKIVFY